MIQPIGETLANVSWAALDGAAREKLKCCVLANFSVAVAGVPYVRLPEPVPSSSGHFLFNGRRTAAARDAAFYNAAAMHARTQDDFDPIGKLHSATVVMPAALAAAERVDASGEALLDAFAVGYAACTGMSRAFSPRTNPKGLRATGLYTPFGAAAAVGRMAGLDARGLANAIAIAASLTGGLTQCWVDGSDEWQLHAAAAASNGLLAVDLTRHGVRGAAHALDGQAGFYRALADCTPRFEDVAADFDADRAILETVIKRYPVSGICQPIVQLSERLASKAAADPARIERVTIAMNPAEMRYPGTLNKGPFRSFSDVLMSAAFCCASVLVNRGFAFGDLFDLGRADRNRLIAATDVRDDAALPPLSCRIELQLAGGAMLSDTLLDGGAELASDWASLDAWAAALWREAGRPDYTHFRDAVSELDRISATALIDTLS
ncbi:MAG: MmgE/PrpD family protein [Candidatus Binatia bacterium]